MKRKKKAQGIGIDIQSLEDLADFMSRNGLESLKLGDLEMNMGQNRRHYTDVVGFGVPRNQDEDEEVGRGRK